MPRSLLFALTLLATSSALADERPNILRLSAEDISAHLGCYGDPHAITPNLDELAEQGARFTNAYTTAGVCAPCRSGIITGMYQNAIGTHHMRCDATLPDWLKPFPTYLREAGYYCTNNSKTDYQFSKPSARDIWDESSGKAHWRNRPDDAPFFAVFNYTGCHESGIADEAKYEDVTADLTDDQRQDPAALTTLPPYYPDTPVVREDWKRNYEVITAMDQWAGDLIGQLKEDGLWENTIVMFWSDHGVGLPRAKRWLYDSGTRIPMLLRVPEKFQTGSPLPTGSVDDRLVNSVDFGPTMLALAGIEIPGRVHGRNFLDVSSPRSFVFGARDRMDERYDIIRAVRDKRFRYIRNFEPLKPYYQYMNTPEKGATMQEIRKAEESGEMPETAALFSAARKPTEELYDLENDPHEIDNLAADPAYAETLARLKTALTEWQLRIGDLGLIPESEIERLKQGAGSDFAILRQHDDPPSHIRRLTSAADAASSAPEIERLLSFATDEDPSVRYWGAIGIGNFSDTAKQSATAASEMTKALEDTAPAVRIAAARALCRMGEAEKGLPVLEAELAGDNQWARLEAAIALDELDETARPSLEALQGGLVDQPNKYIVRVCNKAVNDLLGTSNRVP